ncbi:diguanylate cyclase (GGDEF)-like protein [Sedimentibacter acidaminivorans]|uniref:Diguanylate cyclase (GGDEF)-like protein n=1 Tax=Sedimentibacter acidaminivorans TaxID=913099 RepID=A0ABS4GAR9_9FIRM|nr:GGDEF domain-containing protein [Sedimentibacter acidaminivorans]MBP1924783.1 diguanylate cyclase (GGDEF)-like protein [Sedimentibacter acidaminivorans]
MDFIFQSIGLTLASLQSVLSPIYSVIIANSFMYVGAILLLFGVGKFMNIKIQNVHYIFSSILFICLYSIFTLFYPNTRIRLIVFTIMILPVFTHTICIILFKADRKHRRFAVHVTIAHALLVLIHGSRAYIGLSNFRLFDYSYLHQSESIFIMISLLLMVYLTFSITQMIYMKLLHQLDQSIDYTKDLLVKTQHLANTDNLTKIYNRGKIEDTLKEQMNIYEIYDRLFSVLMVDIDHFKRFNDQYGHDFGDQVIIEVSRLLQQNLRATDSIGRWGGEEFLIVLRDSNLQIAQSVGQKLINIIGAKTLEYGEIKENMTISIGCSEMKESYTMSKLIKSADIALYEAKQNGRNRIEINS